MKQAKLETLFEENETTKLSWEGQCHDCGEGVVVKADWIDDEIVISNGAIYEVKLHDGDEKIFLKCQSCYDRQNALTNYQPCEVYSRVVGYYRPLKNMCNAKQEEYKMRTNFNPFGLESKAESLRHCD